MPTRPFLRSRIAHVAIVFAALWLSSPVLADAQGVTDRGSSTPERGVDAAVRPGDDFFAYANGAWLKATTIPAGKDRWGVRDEINALTRQQVLQLLDDARGAPRGSLGRQVADFRAAWLDERAIASKGIAPLRPLLDSIGRLPDKTALAALLGRWVRADVDPLNWGIYQSAHLVGLSVEPGIHGEKRYVAFLLQGGLGLGDRERYLGTDAAAQALRTRYLAYIGRMLTLAGFEHADQRAAAVMALETALAQHQASPSESARDRNADTVWTRADLARRAPGMDWSVFLAAAGLGKVQGFGAWQPGALVGVARLVATQPLLVWQDYLRFHLLDEHAELLPRDFAEAALSMRSAVAGGAPPSTRAARAVEATQLALGDAIGRMYAERHFPPEQKARVRAIVSNVAAAFRRRVERATWLSPATRTRALAKLQALYVGIGYPEQWPVMTDLVIDPADPIGNQRRIADRNYRRALSRLDRPVDMTEWWIAPQTAGAILVFQQNACDFSAALLQAPKFDATASDAASYGAIGAIIGHDISHFIDLLGAEYDVDGAMRPWWTADDRSRFEALAAPLVRQFSEYRPFPDAPVDGKHSETENVADLAGLAAAFDAYRLTLGARIGDKELVRQCDREFFLGFAQSWRAKIGETAMRQQAASDHAPEVYRVATVRNFDAWYDAFGVTPGDRLYLPPNVRVRVW
jgi:predicted metalloendopeptidase